MNSRALSQLESERTQLMPRVVSQLALAKREYQTQAVVDPRHEASRYATCPFGEHHSVNRRKLRDVCHRILRKSGFRCADENVAGGVQKLQIRREDQGNGGVDATSIESVRLNDNDGSAVARLSPNWFAQVRPPYFASLYYHSARCAVRRCAFRTAISS